jgi:hypothetical protein
MIEIDIRKKMVILFILILTIELAFISVFLILFQHQLPTKSSTQDGKILYFYLVSILIGITYFQYQRRFISGNVGFFSHTNGIFYLHVER